MQEVKNAQDGNPNVGLGQAKKRWPYGTLVNLYLSLPSK